MSDSTPENGLKSFMTISKTEFGRNTFGSPLLHNLIKAVYLWGIITILLLALTLSPTFVFALIALIISRVRYSATKLEKDVEKHGDLISKVRRKVFAETGIQMQPEHVVRLWMNKIVITEGWVFNLKDPAGEDNLEIIGAELKR